jgi:hypothetical protein
MIEFPEARFERVGNVTMVLNMPACECWIEWATFL